MLVGLLFGCSLHHTDEEHIELAQHSCRLDRCKEGITKKTLPLLLAMVVVGATVVAAAVKWCGWDFFIASP